MKRLLTVAIVTALVAAPTFVSAELRRSGFLGIAVATDDGQLAVRGTAEGGSGKEAGVLAGDVITKLDGKPVAGAAEFVASARSLRAGDIATLDVVRSGNPMQLRVPVKPRPFESAPGIETAYGDVTVDGHLRRTLLATPKESPGKLPGVLLVNG